MTESDWCLNGEGIEVGVGARGMNDKAVFAKVCSDHYVSRSCSMGSKVPTV